MVDGLRKKQMKLPEKIKSFFNDDASVKTEKIIIAQKSCPHCASRGLFVFKSTDNSQISNGKSNEIKS